MSDEDVKKIGEAMEQALEPVYGQLERIEKVQGEHTDKIDALTLEMHEIKQDLGIFKDYTHTQIEKIKTHIGLPSTES